MWVVVVVVRISHESWRHALAVERPLARGGARLADLRTRASQASRQGFALLAYWWRPQQFTPSMHVPMGDGVVTPHAQCGACVRQLEPRQRTVNIGGVL